MLIEGSEFAEMTIAEICSRESESHLERSDRFEAWNSLDFFFMYSSSGQVLVVRTVDLGSGPSRVE
jgi:hypothetical protein